MKLIQNSFTKLISFQFSQIKTRGNTGSSRNVQKNPNIQINHKIVDSRELVDLLNLHKQQHELFNFINYSTLYKKITQLSRDKIDKDFLKQINSGLYHKLLTSNEWKDGENISRPIAQLCFYFSKILELQQVNLMQSYSSIQQNQDEQDQQKDVDQEIQAIQKILDEEGIRLFPSMNDQEKANFLYQLGKRGQVQLIKKIANEVEICLQPVMELKAILSIFYGLTISGYTQNDLILKIDDILLKKLSKFEAINQMSCRDISDMLFSYSKNQHLLGDSQIFSLIEKAAALPYSSNSSDNTVPQKRYRENSYNNNRYNNDRESNWLNKDKGFEQKKIATLFRNDQEIDTLSISSMFNSIANFNENKFSYDFYERFENIIILLRFKNTRQLANAFRGMALYYTPSDQIFSHFERQALSFLDKGYFEKDLHSFSTILYFMALHNKGSLNFYQNFEKFTIKNLRNFNNRQLNFIFFSFKFSLHYHLNRQNKDQIIDYIISCFPKLSLEEVSSIILNFRQFEEDNKRRELFFEEAKKHIESIDLEDQKENPGFQFLFYWSIFQAFNKQNQTKDLTEILPNFTKKFTQFINKIETDISSQNYLKNFNIQKSQLDDMIIMFEENEKLIISLQKISNELFI